LLEATRAELLKRRALRLEYLTITWNTVEALVAIAAGVAAGSIALVGFGFDSVIEAAAASVVVWQLRGKAPRERELRALRFIAITFFVLAAYVTFESIRDLVTRDEPASSPAGIALAIVSLLVMPTLAWFKRKTGREMGSPVLVADSAETFLCGWLSAILLVGLVLNATVGWWWADPVAALGIALLAVKEGREAWSGEEGEITPEATRRE
jgi:divalent metal cation (Fe/Co/Zn/Cd) transporter